MNASSSTTRSRADLRVTTLAISCRFGTRITRKKYNSHMKLLQTVVIPDVSNTSLAFYVVIMPL
jgi:hypothetical protein